MRAGCQSGLTLGLVIPACRAWRITDARCRSLGLTSGLVSNETPGSDLAVLTGICNTSRLDRRLGPKDFSSDVCRRRRAVSSIVVAVVGVVTVVIVVSLLVVAVVIVVAVIVVAVVSLLVVIVVIVVAVIVVSLRVVIVVIVVAVLMMLLVVRCRVGVCQCA